MEFRFSAVPAGVWPLLSARHPEETRTLGGLNGRLLLAEKWIL